MDYTRLGRTGLKVSRICLGTMNFGWSADETTSHAIMDAALDTGINFFDTADIYSRWIDGNKGGESESIIGSWLKTRSRREVVIATKVRGKMWEGVNGEGLSRAHILQAVADSLNRLDTDYIDLYQVHFPDDETPLDETLEALNVLVSSGMVRYIGASNYPAWLLMKSLWISDVKNYVRFDTLQPNYSLFHRGEYELELEKACHDQQIGVIPYSPLAAGFATGKYRRDNPDTTRAESGLIKRLVNNDKAYDALETAEAIAKTHNIPVAQIALAWLLAKPTITAPIIGARTIEQLHEVIGAVNVKLSSDEISTLDEATKDF
jgi:aryl-alcohol dehydrogenase-like predicted oxidoreductase